MLSSLILLPEKSTSSPGVVADAVGAWSVLILRSLGIDNLLTTSPV
jgi:hypothetical protein